MKSIVEITQAELLLCHGGENGENIVWGMLGVGLGMMGMGIGCCGISFKCSGEGGFQTYDTGLAIGGQAVTQTGFTLSRRCKTRCTGFAMISLGAAWAITAIVGLSLPQQ